MTERNLEAFTVLEDGLCRCGRLIDRVVLRRVAQTRKPWGTCHLCAAKRWQRKRDEQAREARRGILH